MDFGFPHFTRASTDEVYTQPTQKSLLELVIEAKGRLGLVPQREAPKRHPSSSSFSHFSDSDEEREGRNSEEVEAEPLQDAVLTTRTSWVPPTYLLDYFFSGEFLSVFLSLHGIHASRPVSKLVPPLLTVRDAQLHPLVEAGFCAALQNAAHGSSNQQRGGGGGGRGRGGVRGQGGRGDNRAGFFPDSFFRGGSQKSYMGSSAAAAHNDSSFFSSRGAAQQDQRQSVVLGVEEGNDDGAAGPNPSCVDAQCGMGEAAAASLAQRLLLRGLQQVALPALLLGDHVLLSGPRGIGKRTAALLSAGANVLAYADNADPDGSGETEDPPPPSDGEGEAAAAKPPAAAGESACTLPTNEETTQEDGTEDAVDAADTHPATAEPATAPASASPLAPRALIVLSSYPEVLSTAHWLEAVFGPAAFAVHTFQKDDVTLCPLLEAPAAAKQSVTLDVSQGSYLGHTAGHTGVMPVLPSTTSDRRFIGPPLSLPYLTDTIGASGAPAPPLADPTQADHAPLHAASTLPALSELASLVMDASLPALSPSEVQRSTGGECTSRAHTARKRQRRGEEENQSCGDDDDKEGDEKRSSHTHHHHHHHHHRHRHRHQSRRGGGGAEEEGAEDRGKRDPSSHRSHRRRRRRSSDGAEGGDSSKHTRSLEAREPHSHRRSVRECDHRRRRHHSSSGGRSHRHRSRSEERRSRYRSSSRHRRHRHHRSSSHRHRHHRSRSQRDWYDEDSRSASSSSSSSPTTTTSSADASSTSSSLCRSEGSPSVIPTNAEAVLPPVLDNSVAPPTADELRALALASVASFDISVEAPVTSFTTADAERQREAIEKDTTTQPSGVLRQRVPLLITTYHALQTALGMVQGEASALPPLEHVRVALFANLERALMPPLKDSFLHTWWVSLVNALDVECQFVVTADRMGSEVRGFLDSTVVPDAGERLVHFEQSDASIWAIMDVQVCAVPVELPAAASPPNDGSGGRPRISASDIDAAKVIYLFSTINKHMPPKGLDEMKYGETAAIAAHRDRQAARVVVVCSARREQSQVVTRLQRLFEDQEQDRHPSMVRVTDTAELFRASGAEVLVVTDAQLADPRVLRDVHQCTEVDLILHFSLPRPVMVHLEKKEIIDVLAQRGRAILGHSKQFSSRRWWRGEAAASTVGGGGGGDAAASGSPNNITDFLPTKVQCQLLLTEHNMHGRAGSCVVEALREVSDD
ncbi:hypothetical protein JKF63_05257 [Porcisia hertigi]|uniref:Uncharacterized protein n=1 Tax=Porcisia hertigi TaxID=2761500 RepID=A0A836LE70_9TRYP|nr:hypothetical protein JKF63_05257 [Porcisia hertigi]